MPLKYKFYNLKGFIIQLYLNYKALKSTTDDKYIDGEIYQLP